MQLLIFPREKYLCSIFMQYIFDQVLFRSTVAKNKAFINALSKWVRPGIGCYLSSWLLLELVECNAFISEMAWQYKCSKIQGCIQCRNRTFISHSFQVAENFSFVDELQSETHVNFQDHDIRPNKIKWRKNKPTTNNKSRPLVSCSQQKWEPYKF